jgi:hypothetical protein
VAPGHWATADGLHAKANGRTGATSLDEASWLREGCWEWVASWSTREPADADTLSAYWERR